LNNVEGNVNIGTYGSAMNSITGFAPLHEIIPELVALGNGSKERADALSQGTEPATAERTCIPSP